MLGRQMVSWSLLGVCSVLIGACSEELKEKDDQKGSIKNEFVVKRGDDVVRVYGHALAEGRTPKAAVTKFIETRTDMLRASVDDLKVVPVGKDGQTVQPVMYDPTSGEYKFNQITYRQYISDIPVFQSGMSVLVRNTKDNPVVLANVNLRDLTGFSPTVANTNTYFSTRPAAVVGDEIREDFKGAALKAVDVVLTRFTSPDTVIWAGLPDKSESPRLAITYIGDNSTDPDRSRPEKWRFVADKETGEVIYKKSLIIFSNVGGSVHGLVTQGAAAMACVDEISTPLSWADVSIDQGASSRTDAEGAFSILNPDDEDVTVVSTLSGKWFHVETEDDNEVLSQTVAPPGPARFVHNQQNQSEAVLAQVNAYAKANEVRDWVLSINPDYPVVAEQTDFPINVNLNGGLCPGNAWYDGDSINFCASGMDYANTAFASVIHHEYGHHLVEVGGSGQDEYGEGMADTVGMLINEDPSLGLGFYEGDCENPLRSADNDCEYAPDECSTCGFEIHDCGQLLSGIVWSIREAMIESGIENYMEVLSGVVVNSILLHEGTRIDDSILIDFLTLDDTDGDLNNGTPHWDQICKGFGAHGFECPELHNYLTIEAPDAVTEGDGLLTEAVRVTLAWPIETDLVVYVASDDMSEAEVVGHAIIPAGQVSAEMDLEVKNDVKLDGTQRVRLTALAPDMVQGSVSISVHDNETAALSLTLPETIAEGTVEAGTLLVDQVVDSDVSVHLFAEDEEEVSVPSTVVIPEGSDSVDFEITALSDGVLDGDKVVSINAEVVNWTDATTQVTVVDDIGLHLNISAALKEGQGVIDGAGSVAISGIMSEALVVTLASQDESELLVPATVTIPAGATTGMFDIEVIDDALIDGTADVNVTATAEGFVSDEITVQVLDNDPGAMSFGDAALSGKETSSAVIVTVIREPSSVGTVSVDFATQDATAIAGEDYVETFGTLTFEVGETAQSFEVPILDDDITEGNEKLVVVLSNPQGGGELGLLSTAVLTILDDDITDYFTQGFDIASDADADMDTDTDTDMDTDADMDADTDVDTDADADGDTDADADGDTDADTNRDENGTMVVNTKRGTVTVEQDFDLEYKTVTLTPDGSHHYYSACIEDAEAFPTDPEEGTPIRIGDDDFQRIDIADGRTVSLYGQHYESFYVADNGYITFTDGDRSCWPSFENHFELPRISMLYTDLMPDYGNSDTDTDTDTDTDADTEEETETDADTEEETDGNIDTEGFTNNDVHVTASSEEDTAYPLPTDADTDYPSDSEMETETEGDGGTDPLPYDDNIFMSILSDKVVVTYDNIQQWGGNARNSFQVEMFFDGRIRITWLNIETPFGIVGISEGEGYPSLFFESDFSAYDRCDAFECDNDEMCGDGLVCNGRELCVDNTCVDGAPPVCDDGVLCTQDSCSEANGGCVAYPDDTQCDDGDVCTQDICDAATGGCTNIPMEGCCGDGLCDGEETSCTCAEDCGIPTSDEYGLCEDGLDNDCDGTIDDNDVDCICIDDWQRCESNDECCSKNCVGLGQLKWCFPIL